MPKKECDYFFANASERTYSGHYAMELFIFPASNTCYLLVSLGIADGVYCMGYRLYNTWFLLILVP